MHIILSAKPYKRVCDVFQTLHSYAGFTKDWPSCGWDIISINCYHFSKLILNFVLFGEEILTLARTYFEQREQWSRASHAPSAWWLCASAYALGRVVMRIAPRGALDTSRAATLKISLPFQKSGRGCGGSRQKVERKFLGVASHWPAGLFYHYI